MPVSHAIARARPAGSSPVAGTLAALVVTAVGTGSVLARPPSAATPERVERRLALMGTRLDLVVEATDRPTALRASEAAVEALEKVEARLSTWTESSELAAVNRSSAASSIALSPELARDLSAVDELNRWTEGAFDPTVGALTRAWGLRTGGRQPSEEELAAARHHVGWRRLVRIGEGLLTKAPGVVLDEGGFGKGVGLDRALAAATAAGATSLTLDLGGQVVVSGREETVAVASPTRRDHATFAIRIEHGSLATSGNSERAILVDGKPRGHLLDPRTGRPAPDWGSLTVWAQSATAADALSTGLWILGPDRALAVAARTPGLEVLTQEVTPEGLRARASAGLWERLTAVETFVTPGAEGGSRNEGDGERYATGVVRSPSPVPSAPTVAAAGAPQ